MALGTGRPLTAGVSFRTANCKSIPRHAVCQAHMELCGCTNSKATNYNPDAIINNNMCHFGPNAWCVLGTRSLEEGGGERALADNAQSARAQRASLHVQGRAVRCRAAELALRPQRRPPVREWRSLLEPGQHEARDRPFHLPLQARLRRGELLAGKRSPAHSPQRSPTPAPSLMRLCERLWQ